MKSEIMKFYKKILIYLIVICVIMWIIIYHLSPEKDIGLSKFDDSDEVDPRKDDYFSFKVPELPEKNEEHEAKNKFGMFDIKDIVKKNKIFWSKVDSSTDRSMSSAMGLTFHNREFYLNGKAFRIFSGSIHYFRVVPESWRDRLQKLKACGLNTVETYVPWNLHEPSPGVYRFEGLLDLRAFIKLAAELGIYVILRPGPYICSEIDFGGLPGWLLEDENMKVRSNYKGYLKAVIRYFSVLLPKFRDLQFTEGGPIIMVQVENEYAVYGENVEHLKMLAFLLRKAGIKELLVTSDNTFHQKELYFHEYALPTSNAKTFQMEHYNIIRDLNKHFPFMVMELWSGWFSSWGDRYKAGRDIASLKDTITQVLKVGGSFNLYMFHGGTNFGFTAGAVNLTKYAPFVTSYDYDALLTESGDTTAKYTAVRNLMLEFYASIGIKHLPKIPPDSPKIAYGRLAMEETLDWNALFNIIPLAAISESVTYREKHLDSNGHSQSLGYIIYSRAISNNFVNNIPGIQLIGYVKDRLLAILNSQLFYVLHGHNSQVDPFLDYDWNKHFTRVMKTMETGNSSLSRRLDLVVDNLGRISYSPRSLDLLNKQRKGLNGPVFRLIFGDLYNWQLRFLTFNPEQCKMFSKSMSWAKIDPDQQQLLQPRRLVAPALFRTHLLVDGSPKDTFIQLQGWIKGVVFVNGFNLGRYWNIGPQMTLYLPASLLHKGQNEILIFEEEQQANSILLSAKDDLGTISPFT